MTRDGHKHNSKIDLKKDRTRFFLTHDNPLVRKEFKKKVHLPYARNLRSSHETR